MGTVRYTVIDGEVVSELRGGVKRDYVPDPLGSTVALLDNAQAKTDTFEYWPYGESSGRTGTTSTPFQYVGTMGYYNDSSSKNYVRARYLDKRLAKWITEDPLLASRWQKVNFYSSSSNNSTTIVDPSGKQGVRKDRLKIGIWPPQWGSGPTIIYPPGTHGPGIPRPPVGWNPNPPKTPKGPCTLGDAACVKRAVEAIEHQIEDHLYGHKIGIHNGPGDAFKHCLLAGLVAFNCSENAYQAGIIGHELPKPAILPWSFGSVDHNWLPSEGNMDLHNNEEGKRCALQTGNANGIFICCLNKFNNGTLWMLPPCYWDDEIRNRNPKVPWIIE